MASYYTAPYEVRGNTIIMNGPVTPVLPLQEAITAEIPKVKEHTPFNPVNFTIAVTNKGPSPVCCLCGWLYDGSTTNLEYFNTRAEEHWMEKHT